MSKLIEQIDTDLKQAMLSGDKPLVSVLRGIKSALQYAAVAGGAGTQLSESEILKVLQKESKKRADAIELYQKANDQHRQDQEQYEKNIIDNYLPAMLGEAEVIKLIDEAISSIGNLDQSNMGRIIGEVRQKSDGRADGGLIARLVKERLK